MLKTVQMREIPGRMVSLHAYTSSLKWVGWSNIVPFMGQQGLHIWGYIITFRNWHFQRHFELNVKLMHMLRNCLQ